MGQIKISNFSIVTDIKIKMVEQTTSNGCHVLTEEETALYDRQIRLWGVEAQQRLRKARILLVGLTGLGNEVCKNILLAGIQHLTMLDDTVLSKEDSLIQFLAPQESVGMNKAEASLLRAKELNPMVDIVVDTENIEKKSDSFFSQFDVVCMTGCNAELEIKINDICHKLGVKFLSGNVFGYYGYMFADLGEHSYMAEKVKIVNSKKNGEGPSSAKRSKIENDDEVEYEEKTTTFCTLSDALSSSPFQGKSLSEAKKFSKTFLVMKVLHEYQKKYKCLPNQVKSNQELENLLDVRNEVFEKLQIDNELLTDEFSDYCTGTLYPVNPIVGGVMAQEVIKAVSRKDTPHNNFFFYDAVSTGGVVQQINKVETKILEEKPTESDKKKIVEEIVL